jgi:hypothetical protein
MRSEIEFNVPCALITLKIEFTVNCQLSTLSKLARRLSGGRAKPLGDGARIAVHYLLGALVIKSLTLGVWINLRVSSSSFTPHKLSLRY